MGYELYYEGHISLDRPVSLVPPDEDRLSDLASFFTPVFEQAEGTPTGRHVTGFRVDEETANWANSWPWHENFAAIEEFARCPPGHSHCTVAMAGRRLPRQPR